MPKDLIKTEGYKELVKKIQSELTELDFFIRRRTAEGYWRIGKYIHEHLHANKDRAGYGARVYDQLIKDVNRDKSTLQRAVQFYRTYPIVAEPRQLSWDHYKSLITVHDKTKREAFEKMALKRDWTAGELEETIRLDRLKYEESKEKPQKSSYKLQVTRSRLYTYQILEPSYIHPTEEKVVVDVGFKIDAQVALSGIARPQGGQIVESAKISSGYTFKLSDAKPKELYTYKALVERVVDADTIYLNIDCGFDIWYREKVRLRGIDAPELSTQKGQEAKKLVEARLKEVEFVVVKTYKEDKYERFLADIFYSVAEKDPFKVAEEGVFLNQELLNKGLARIFV